ncbi:hypothetical protein [Acidicapsa acidisoli]|uniref:hypothetical protein n=1 Tax=Acidicapsa acidisoli TaxID=1615681 RepID=UPI0021E0447D|nr:hypothetical protein [Acidicapsa acidisoli]
MPKRSANAQFGLQMPVRVDPMTEPKTDSLRDALADDPRWRLARSIATGNHFARSPLLSQFLLYVVAETLMGRQVAVTEHQIGVHVFGRPRSYRTDEDNIVRNYARQLRKRLAEHFAGNGNRTGMRIEIPVGGYVPVFCNSRESESCGQIESQVENQSPAQPQSAADVGPAVPENPESSSAPSLVWRFLRKLAVSGKMGIAVYSVVLVCSTWVAASRILVPSPPPEPAQLLWKEILRGADNTYIVPPDAGLNLLEDISHQPSQLADYIRGSYLGQSLPNLDNHTTEDIRTQRFTDFVSLQVLADLTRQQEYDPRHVLLRFPRELRLDNLKTSNVVLIGSVNSNPWSTIADSETNFRIVPNVGMEGASIVNTRPQPGESVSYASHWNEPSHETFALIDFVPNLSGNGHLLLLEGLDVAGTQSAAELLFHSTAISSILKRAQRPDGSLRPFEILLRSTSIQSDSAGSQIVATRFH